MSNDLNYLEFEEPIAKLEEQLEKAMEIQEEGEVDASDTIKELEDKINKARKKIYKDLTGWQRVQLSRHPKRPYSLFYLEQICDPFIEQHGDRNVKDDKAIVGGFGAVDGKTMMFIGHQKGRNTKMRQYRNFGMANPEGYRKALRLMKLAEKFEKPVVTFIDTPGAFPGIEAEERGQAEAIARNLYEMMQLKVPILCVVIGEGASGGALGIGIGDRILMMENTWYSVIAPESCSSILWRSWEHKEEAAENLKLTAKHMKEFGLVDDIVKEPLGGAHANPQSTAEKLKKAIKKHIRELEKKDPEKRAEERVQKFSDMGEFKERRTKKSKKKRKTRKRAKKKGRKKKQKS